MCGIVVTRDYARASQMLRLLRHRGPDGMRLLQSHGWWVGHARLAIVDLSDHGQQPLQTVRGLTAFNGEIYNYISIAEACMERPLIRNEIFTLDMLLAESPQFMRVLDGDFALARVDDRTGDLWLARDWVGVVPLYYEKRGKTLYAVASERKALTGKAIEVRPGQTLVFDSQGRQKWEWTWDPISLHLKGACVDRLVELFQHAVRKRVLHADVPVAVALSGGLDSSMVLKAVVDTLGPTAVSAVTVASVTDSDEKELATSWAHALGVPHKVLRVTDSLVARHWQKIMYHLEDPNRNPVKWRGMLRNYFVARAAPPAVKVLLTGEGADEIFCGYPSHQRAVGGLALEWKSLGTFQSMPAINLDRVNKGGLAWGKEYRVPFLDRDLVLEVMACKKTVGKQLLREMAERMGIPEKIRNRSKYGVEERRLEQLYETAAQRKMMTDPTYTT